MWALLAVVVLSVALVVYVDVRQRRHPVASDARPRTWLPYEWETMVYP
jgi:hypothetical protein